MRKLSKILPVFLILSFLAVPLIAYADINPLDTICHILTTVKNVIGAIGFAIAFIILIIGAITYMTAGGDEEKATKGRKLMINAVIGIVILIAAFIIINLIAGILRGSVSVTDWNPFSDPCVTPLTR